MKLKTVSILIATLFIGAPAFAADLIDVYRDALAQDPVYASARLALEANREVLPQARAGTLPSISASGNFFPPIHKPKSAKSIPMPHCSRPYRATSTIGPRWAATNMLKRTR